MSNQKKQSRRKILKISPDRQIRPIMLGTPLTYSASSEEKYSNQLTKLVDTMIKQTLKSVVRLFKGEAAQEFNKAKDKQETQKVVVVKDESLSSSARILANSLFSKFRLLFGKESKSLAEQMFVTQEKESTKKVETSMKALTGQMTIKGDFIPDSLKEVGKAIIAENISLIKSIPEQYMKNVQGDMMRAISVGGDLQALTKTLIEEGKVTKRRASLIAEDQVRKAYNAINREKLLGLGIKKFRWLHSGGGQHPRKSHQALSGQVFSFDDLPVINQEQVDKGREAPVKGIPGQAINCGCTMLPVIEWNKEEDK